MAKTHEFDISPNLIFMHEVDLYQDFNTIRSLK